MGKKATVHYGEPSSSAFSATDPIGRLIAFFLAVCVCLGLVALLGGNSANTAPAPQAKMSVEVAKKAFEVVDSDGTPAKAHKATASAPLPNAADATNCTPVQNGEGYSHVAKRLKVDDWKKLATPASGSTTANPTLLKQGITLCADGSVNANGNPIKLAAVEIESKTEIKVPAPVPKAHKAAPASSNDSVWNRLAHCESTNNWAINTGNGYYGGLQFDKGTWSDFGGTAYAPRADMATKAQQIEIATKVRDARGGYGSWPACAKKLGLPR